MDGETVDAHGHKVHIFKMMQIIGLNKGGALFQVASLQEASQENWFNLPNSTNVLAKSWF